MQDQGPGASVPNSFRRQSPSEHCLAAVAPPQPTAPEQTCAAPKQRWAPCSPADMSSERLYEAKRLGGLAAWRERRFQQPPTADQYALVVLTAHYRGASWWLCQCRIRASWRCSACCWKHAGKQRGGAAPRRHRGGGPGQAAQRQMEGHCRPGWR